MVKKIFLGVLVSLIFLTIGGEAMALELNSPVFKHNEFIPRRYTCQGEDISPELNWSGVPLQTKSLVLICDDPDAPMGTWVHWVVYDIPVDKGGFSEGVATDEILEGNIKQGITDFGGVGYGGPCPPPGKPHRYFFKLYCLDTMLNLKPGLRKDDILKAIKGHVIAETQLIGLYKR